jgi:GT2 family glycosyltransferase
VPAKLVYRHADDPIVTVVIPTLDGSRSGNVDRLIERFRTQDFAELEIILSIGEHPNGHARNVGYGAASPSSRFLLFFDDDVDFQDSAMVSKFVKALSEHEDFGLVGALIKRPPEQDSPFLRWIEREGGRHVAEDVDSYVESNMVCHAGLGIRREVWERLGGESSTIPTGTDTDLRLRVRQAGLKVILLPETKVYHPFPGSAGEMWRRTWEHGLKHHLFREVHPDAMDEACELVDSRRKAYAMLLKSALKLIPHFIVDKKLRPIFRPVNAVNSFLFHSGYAIGWLRQSRRAGPKPLKPMTKPSELESSFR